MGLRMPPPALQCALHAGEQQRAVPDGGFEYRPAYNESIGAGLEGTASRDRASKPATRGVDQDAPRKFFLVALHLLFDHTFS